MRREVSHKEEEGRGRSAVTEASVCEDRCEERRWGR